MTKHKKYAVIKWQMLKSIVWLIFSDRATCSVELICFIQIGLFFSSETYREAKTITWLTTVRVLTLSILINSLDKNILYRYQYCTWEQFATIGLHHSYSALSDTWFRRLNSRVIMFVTESSNHGKPYLVGADVLVTLHHAILPIIILYLFKLRSIQAGTHNSGKLSTLPRQGTRSVTWAGKKMGEWSVVLLERVENEHADRLSLGLSN